MKELKEVLKGLDEAKAKAAEERLAVLRGIALELFGKLDLVTSDESDTAVALFNRSPDNVLTYYSDKQLELAVYSHSPNLQEKQRREVMKYVKLHTFNTKAIDMSTVAPVAFADEFNTLTWNRLKVSRSQLEQGSAKPPKEFEHILSLCDDPKALVLFIGSLLDPHASRAQYLHLHGGGGNGKSTLFAALRDVFGSRYVVSTRADEFMGSYWGDSVEGARILMFAEENSTRFFSSGKFKEFTGEEVVTVNPKFEKPRRIRLTHKTVVLSNNKVEISSSVADRRRLLSISMEDDPDQNLGFRWWYDGLRRGGEDILAYCFSEYLKAVAKEPSVRAFIPQSTNAAEQAIERKYEDFTEAIRDTYEITEDKGDWVLKVTVLDEVAERLGERRTNPVFKQNLSDALKHLGVSEGKVEGGSKRVFRGIKKKGGSGGTKLSVVDSVSSKAIPPR